MNRAYSLLRITRAYDDDEDKRVIEGIATTPTADRAGDIVEPTGAEFQLPIPLLWQHDASQPIGQVTSAKVTKNGIAIRAWIAKVDDPGKLKDRLDEAWQSIKSGLVGGLSIGFRALEADRIEETFSYRFVKWLWLELSAVTIPANSDATITAIKSIDAQIRAASGIPESVDPAAVAASKKAAIPVVKSKPTRSQAMNIAEQITSFEAARGSKQVKMAAIMEDAAKDGQTLDPQQTEEYDGLIAEIDAIDAHLKRLRAHEKVMAHNAAPAEPVAITDTVTSRPVMPAQVKAPQKLAPGIGLARIARCKALAKLDNESVRDVARSLYGEESQTYGFFTKAAVGGGQTGNNAWAGNLVGDETSVFADFVEFLRPMTIMGRFGANGIPALRRVPFRTALVGQTSGGNAYWVGEGKPKPLTKFDFTRTTLEPLKVANIAVVTMEVLRDSSPSAEGIVRDQLAAAVRERLDIDFIDPAKAVASGVSPASITNSITPISSAGNDADAVRLDIKALFEAFIAENNAPTNGVWIMPSTVALALSLMINPLGQPEFPAINMMGGTLYGLPVITSEYVPSTTSGAYVVLVNASDIYMADEGGVSVDMSMEASLQMDDNPATQNGLTGVGTSLVSLWQTNMVGFKAERTVNWARRRAGSVAVLDDVNWGAPGT